MPRPPLLLLALLTACGTVPPRPLAPVPAAASEAFAEARRLDREGRGDDACEAARVAAGLAPDWIAPRRFLDDVARDELRTPEVLAGYRRHLARSPEDPAALYLAGRLEGTLGQERLLTAQRLGPRHGWVWHGLGWNAHLRGETSVARRHAHRAAALARDPYERAYFTWARARIEREAGEEDLAAQLLADRIADPDTDEGDRTWLAVELVRLELQSDDAQRRRRGAYRAVYLLETAPLLASEIRPLVDGAWIWGHTEPGRAALHLALTGADDPARRRERGRLLELEGPSRLALSLLDEGASPDDLRTLRFAYGDPAAVVEAWVGALPIFVLEDGAPRDPRLAALLDAAQVLGPPATWTRDGVRAFGGALLAAGWFEEARAFASRSPGGDQAFALELDARAQAGQGVIDELVRLGRAFDRGRPRYAPGVTAAEAMEADEAESIEDLDGVLDACAPALARAARFLGGSTEPEVWSQRLAGSARIRYGIAGEVLHPGPTFSTLDEARGLGDEGANVPGLAEVLEGLGRFGLFGQGLGQAPDGALLRRVLVEERAGAHLGQPWRGTIAWCDGADLAPRAGRGGARIAGAALHEGYWIDLSVLREERARWTELYARFEDDLALPLAVAPMEVEPHERPTETRLLLDAASRLRLAIMRDRGGPPSLEELCEVTAVHEQGHLCDRARFFPLDENWLEVLAFLTSAGFSPSTVAQRLEERAQLVAVCEVEDPRVPLAELLQAAQDGGTGPTPHGAAYAHLCQQFLEELAHQVEVEPGRFEGIDPGAFLGQQTHRLSPAQVRGVALELARRRGLAR